MALALLFALLAHGSAAVRSSALSSTGAQVVPSIRYQIHLAMEGVSRLCLLGCRQYREVHSLIGAHITSVLVVCDDCTTLPAGATGALRIGQGHKVEVSESCTAVSPDFRASYKQDLFPTLCCAGGMLIAQ